MIVVYESIREDSTITNFLEFLDMDLDYGKEMFKQRGASIKERL